MTVEELIEQLEKCDPEAEVLMEYKGGSIPIDFFIAYTYDGNVIVKLFYTKTFEE